MCWSFSYDYFCTNEKKRPEDVKEPERTKSNCKKVEDSLLFPLEARKEAFKDF